MLRPALRAIRSGQGPLAPARSIGGRRFASTQPPHLRSRTWKSSLARWGIAIAGIYYYNTSPVFAEQPQSNLLNPNLEALEDRNDPSILDSLVSRRSRQSEENKSALQSVIETTSSENASVSSIESQNALPDITSPSELEEEAEAEGAFNPVTGEINWDCPCLGGMAHGPCGPEFREAFSCFVFSNEEPKGMDCIDKFQGMRDCFQKYPEVYKDELEDDEELDAGLEAERQELAKEISERQAQQGQVRERRLLEEPVSAQSAAPERKQRSKEKAPPSHQPESPMAEVSEEREQHS